MSSKLGSVQLKAILVTAVLTSLAFNPANAQDANERAVALITDTADKLCVNVDQSGSKTSAEINGEVKTELSGLVKKLASIGVSGQGKIDANEYRGVVQDQLGGTLRDIRACRLKVFEVLQAKLVPGLARPSSPEVKVARNPNALYQFGDIVATVTGAFIEQSSGIISFQAIRSNGSGDPSRAVEYQDYVLSCPQLPAPPQGVIVGQFVGLAAGAQCRIVGKNP